MAVDNKHPDYSSRYPEWRMMRDTYRGTTAVKEMANLYLPYPSGWVDDLDNGPNLYAAYITRAQFPEIVKPTVRGMVGVIHQREAKIELPPSMEFIWENSTIDGLPLEAFHRRITAELLSHGRYAVLVDVPSPASDGTPPANDQPYFSGYTAEHLINWDEHGRSMYVLDETRLVREGFNWVNRKRFRALELVDGAYQVSVYGYNANINVRTEELVGANFTIVPTVRGKGAALTQIPFVVMGATDLAVQVDDPPLVGVAEASLAIYRLDADYRHMLYMSGQETPVFTGMAEEQAPKVIGSGVKVVLPTGADFKYVGPNIATLGEHRSAIVDERSNAISAGARVFDAQNTRYGVESAEALHIRYAANTATLTSIAQTSAAGLEKALRHAGLFMGLSEAEVENISVTPNLEFLDTAIAAADAVQLVSLWQSNAISYETLYENLQRGGIASQERTADEERALREGEPDLNPPVVGLNPNQLNPNDPFAKNQPGNNPPNSLPNNQIPPPQQATR